jgi:hypothetical protein
VGQKVSLRCELSMTNVSVDSYRWQVPGFAISNYFDFVRIKACISGAVVVIMSA